MSKVNEHRKGYKHTPLGWIPEEWEIIRLDNLSEIQQGVSKGKLIDKTLAVKVPYMRVANVKEGTIDLSEVKEILISKNELSKYILLEGDILITEGGDPDKLGRGGMWDGTIKNCVFQNHLFRIRTNRNRLSNFFLYNYFQGYRAKTYFLSCAKQTTGIASINSSQVRATPVVVPTVKEQCRIATILSTWDEAITKTRQLITQLHNRKKGLMQRLLTGKKRLKRFNEPWKEIHLADAFNERSETGLTNLDLLSVGALGVYPQSQSDKRDISNSDKSKYKRICPGDIGYNTMRMWQGRSALSSLEGIVSPSYTIVIPKEGHAGLFYSYLFKFPLVVNKFFRNSQGLVEDTLNCKFKDFSIVKVVVPEFEEQVAIADLLTKATEEILLQEQKLTALQLQKKGLMQKLLTGEVRVNIDKQFN